MAVYPMILYWCVIILLPVPCLALIHLIARISSHILSAGNYASYQWNTNESTSSIEVSTPGQYWVKVTNSNGCIGADTVNILNLNNNPAGFFE
jgi:hypothetical protein